MKEKRVSTRMFYASAWLSVWLITLCFIGWRSFAGRAAPASAG